MITEEELLRLIYILSILIIGGFLGSIVNYCRKSNDNIWKSLSKGVCASLTIPLLLSLIESEVVNDVTESAIDSLKLLGLCIIASIFSDRFIDNLYLKIKDIADRTESRFHKVEKKIDNTLDEITPIVEKNTEKEPHEKQECVELHGSYTNEEEMVLKAMRESNYTYRSLSGIAGELEVEKDVLIKMLLNLKSMGLVGKNEQDRWFLR